MSRQQHWEEVYQTKDAESVSWFQPMPENSLKLIKRADPASLAPVIDVGGGASRLVDCLLDGGWQDVSVLDIAKSALAVSQQRLQDRAALVQWLTGDVTLFDFPKDRYGVWHDRAVFHFLTLEADRQAYAQRLRHALKPGGFAVIAAFAPDGPEKCSGLPVCRHSEESMLAQLGEGFRLIDRLREDHVTPGGKTQSFVYALMQND